MAKKPSLAAVLEKNEKTEDTSAVVEVSKKTPLTKRNTAPKKSSRDGQTNIAAWFPIRVKFQLEELCLKKSRELGRKVTLRELQAECYNDLFKKYGLPEIASVDE